MKKQSVFLLVPVLLNIMAFMKRFHYSTIVMFLLSFLVFFVSLYIDFEKRPNLKRCWNIFSVMTTYISIVFYIFDIETITAVMQFLISLPLAAALVIIIKYALRSEKESAVLNRIHTNQLN